MKALIYLSLILLFFVSPLLAQQESSVAGAVELFPIRKDGKWGYINRENFNGKILDIDIKNFSFPQAIKIE
jgi:hypothetical protein